MQTIWTMAKFLVDLYPIFMERSFFQGYIHSSYNKVPYLIKAIPTY